MGIFKYYRNRKDIGLIVEEKACEYVIKEMATGEIRDGLWAKASVEASSTSDEDIRRKYIQLRVEMLLVEGRLRHQSSEAVLADTGAEKEKLAENIHTT